MPFTLLLSVYALEKPENLLAALESIWDLQTLRPSEIVLVKDGPLTPALDNVIDGFKEKAPVKIIALDRNYGLGYALAHGLEYCTNDLVARMDSDDISKPERFSKQIKMMTDHPELDVLGTDIAEFSGSPDNIRSYRRLPSKFAEIKLFARKRNPLNHMSVVFKKSAVVDAGNYQPFFGYEDYYLWIRMLRNGSVIENISEDLVLARVDKDLFLRRRGIRYFRQELKLEKELLNIGFLNQWEYCRNLIFRALPRLFPVWGIKLVYKIIR